MTFTSSDPSPSMPPPLPPLTLIVATTPALGIGFRGSLPWPTLKADLAFFAKVTKRVPPHVSPPSTQTSPTSLPEHGASSRSEKKPLNAVLMGRKTWDSIPAQFRPLRDRVNIIVSRDRAFVNHQNHDSRDAVPAGSTMTFAAQSIEEGLREYQERYTGRVFLIGGASVYQAALEMGVCERILWTRIRREFECDTWFPAESVQRGENGWRRMERERLESWTAQEGVGKIEEEKGLEFQIELWERESG